MKSIKVSCLVMALLSSLVISQATLAETPFPSTQTLAVTAQKPAAPLSVGAVQTKPEIAKVIIDTPSPEIEARIKAEQEAKARAEAEQREKARVDAEGKAALEKLLTAAEALMKSGKSNEAYEMLRPSEFNLAGDKRFDYLLGIAALDSNKPDKATFALERVLAVDPNFAGARLDMARAYFQLGDKPRAKTEFLAVLKQDPPQAARLTIAKYMDAITAAEKVQLLHITSYIETSVGRDTNVNNSTSQSQVAVPALGNLVFTLNPTNLKTPDSYYTAAAGIDINNKFEGEWGVYLGADARKRGNQSMHSFDFGNVDFRAGVTYGTGDDVFKAGATLGQFSLDHITNRNTVGFTGDWRHSFSASNQLNVFAQYGSNRFADSTMHINNFNQTVVGSGFMHILNGGKTALFGSLNLSSEKAILGRADGNKSGYGLRVGGQTSVLESVDLFANTGFQSGKYSKENAAFMVNRTDRQIDAMLGGNWHLDKNWSLRPQFAYSRNNCNIPIYKFNRIDASVTIRRDFR